MHMEERREKRGSIAYSLLPRSPTVTIGNRLKQGFYECLPE